MTYEITNPNMCIQVNAYAWNFCTLVENFGGWTSLPTETLPLSIDWMQMVYWKLVLCKHINGLIK